MFNSGLRRYDAGTGAMRGSRTGSATTSSTTQSPPSFVVDVSALLDQKRRALQCHVSQFTVSGTRRRTRG